VVIVIETFKVLELEPLEIEGEKANNMVIK
jgi:hypothetical protein